MTAFQTQFKAELIAGFEQTESLIRKTVTTEGTMKGNSFVFAVGDSGSAEAVTRGTNGLIPARADNIAQYTATLVEWHDLVRRTEFNIFASQGDGRKLMQNTVMGTINRKMDQDILLGLSAATQTTGAAQQASLDLVMYAKVILGNNEVPADGNISAIISPAFHAELMKTTEFASVDYINDKPFTNMPVMFRWAGVNFIEHPNLAGKGTAAEICYMYHKSAIGHAASTSGLNTAVGYDEEQDYSFARCSMYMGSKLLQNSGIVKITHDGSNYAAQA
jgi:hypothetical protein